VPFTPTRSSWLDLVESLFSIVDRRVTRRGAHRSNGALEGDIKKFLEAHNTAPTPFIWTKTADQILDGLERYCTRANAERVERHRRSRADQCTELPNQPTCLLRAGAPPGHSTATHGHAAMLTPIHRTRRGEWVDSAVNTCHNHRK
jgi:hypothetical protein